MDVEETSKGGYSSRMDDDSRWRILSAWMRCIDDAPCPLFLYSPLPVDDNAHAEEPWRASQIREAQRRCISWDDVSFSESILDLRRVVVCVYVCSAHWQ